MIGKNIVDIAEQVVKSGEKIATNYNDNKTQRHVSNNDNQTKCHISDNTTAAQKFTATLSAVDSGLNSLSNVMVAYKEYCVSRNTNQVNLDTKSREIEQKREVELSRIAADLEKAKAKCSEVLKAQADRLDVQREIIEYCKTVWQETFELLKSDRELLLSPAGAQFLQQMRDCHTSLRAVSSAVAQESGK